MLLGLHVDLSGFYARAAGDQTLSELADRYRGLKPPRFPTLHRVELAPSGQVDTHVHAGEEVFFVLDGQTHRRRGKADAPRE